MLGLKGIILITAISPAMAGETAASQVERIRGLSNIALCQEVHAGSVPESILLRELKIRGLMCSALGVDDWDYTPESKSTIVSTENEPSIAQSTGPTVNSTSGTPTSAPPATPPEERPLSVEDSVIRVSYGNTVGSGFYIDSTHVITNAHVIVGTGQVSLARSNGAPYPGRVLYRNPEIDFAIIETGTKGTPVPIRQTAQSVGEGIMALGYPQGRMTLAASTGTIRKLMDCCIIHDALIAAGSSGGPLLDRNREVLGLNTLISKMPGDDTNSSDRGITLRLTYISQMLVGNTPASPR